MPHLYPFFCCWTFRLLSCLGYCEHYHFLNTPQVILMYNLEVQTTGIEMDLLPPNAPPKPQS